MSDDGNKVQITGQVPGFGQPPGSVEDKPMCQMPEGLYPLVSIEGGYGAVKIPTGGLRYIPLSADGVNVNPPPPEAAYHQEARRYFEAQQLDRNPWASLGDLVDGAGKEVKKWQPFSPGDFAAQHIRGGRR